MKNKKRAVTLIEIMIVILLIGLIGGALAFNMRGSLEQGKVFKTEQTQLRIYDILSLEMAKGNLEPDALVQSWEEIIKNSPLIKNGSDFLTDAWHKKFKVSIVNDEIVIESEGLNKYNDKHNPTTQPNEIR